MIFWAPQGLGTKSHFPSSAVHSTHTCRLRMALFHTCLVDISCGLSGSLCRGSNTAARGQVLAALHELFVSLKPVPHGRRLRIICQVLLPAQSTALSPLDYSFDVLILSQGGTEVYTPGVLIFSSSQLNLQLQLTGVHCPSKLQKVSFQWWWSLDNHC